MLRKITSYCEYVTYKTDSRKILDRTIPVFPKATNKLFANLPLPAAKIRQELIYRGYLTKRGGLQEKARQLQHPSELYLASKFQPLQAQIFKILTEDLAPYQEIILNLFFVSPSLFFDRYFSTKISSSPKASGYFEDMTKVLNIIGLATTKHRPYLRTYFDTKTSKTHIDTFIGTTTEFEKHRTIPNTPLAVLTELKDKKDFHLYVKMVRDMLGLSKAKYNQPLFADRIIEIAIPKWQEPPKAKNTNSTETEPGPQPELF